MNKKTSILPPAARLRRRAEDQLRQRKSHRRNGDGTRHPDAGPQRLQHELQVHQVELELQNAELRKTRDELEAALENYTDLYDFAPAGYFTLTSDGTIQQVNLTGAHLAGVERRRLVGRAFGMLVAAPQRAAFQNFLQQVFAGQAAQTGDFELSSPGQPARIVSLKAQRLLNGEECRAVVMDITERKRAEDQVHTSEIRFRRLFEAANDGVLLLDPGTRKIIDANPFMTKLLGYSRDWLIGKELFEIGLLKDESASQEMFEKLKRRHQVRYEDLPLETQGGRHQEVEVVANLYQEKSRSVIQCNIRDITARKHAEEVLRRNEALFSALIKQAPMGVYVVDSQFRLQQVNLIARPVFKNIRPLIGRDFSEIHHLLWPKAVSDSIVARFRHTLKTGEAYQGPELAARRRDTGQQEVYEWQIQRVTLPNGEHGVVAFFNDITERKRAEEAKRRVEVLAASNRKLENEIVRRRVVEASLHQSRQHLGRLLRQSQLLQGQLRDLSHQILHAQEEERKRISRELHDEITQSLVLINVQMQTLSRKACTNPQQLDIEIVRTQQLVAKSVAMVHEFARALRPAALDDVGLTTTLQASLHEFMRQTGVRVHFTTFAGADQLNSVLSTVIFRVIQSALSNVARHAQASKVSVCLQKLARTVRLEIADDGQAFDVNRALDKQRNRRLGLIGMRERVEMIGGSFEVRSVRGQGTTIQAELPLIKGRPSPKPNPPAEMNLICHRLACPQRQAWIQPPLPAKTKKRKIP